MRVRCEGEGWGEMALHSSEYVRETLGHTRDSMLHLRTDEVQVFNR